ncbi:hypothetical protein [Pseudomonas sp. D3-10]|uniref:hypothetical protein n=1 Tax=Pseudomonas sp. D3-10 TaxID=2817392 RepID=UPI003DA836FF
MNAALKICQERYDNASPDDDSARDEAISRWVEDNAEHLVRGGDVMFRPRFGPPRGVTQGRFVEKLCDHLRSLQEAQEDDLGELALLVLEVENGGPAKTHARNVAGVSDNPRGKLYEIAESLLEPYADDALIAQAEDNEL